MLFAKKRKKSVNSRAKGATFEVFVSHIFTRFGLPAIRGQQRSGTEERDIIVSNKLFVRWFSVECENRAGGYSAFYKKFFQSKRDCKDEQRPLVVFHETAKKGQKRKPVIVAMQLEDFLTLLYAYGVFQEEEK